MLGSFNSASFTTATGVAVAANADITVRVESSGALASIFSDEAGAVPIAQPGFQADASGRFKFYAAGVDRGYRVTVTKGAESWTLNNVAIGTAGQRDTEDFLLSSILTTAGDILVRTAVGAVRKALGLEGSVLMVDPAQADKLQYVRLGAGDRRQCVLSAALDASGYNAAITTGAGLRPGLDANPTPFVVTFAAGYGAGGAQDLVATLSADVADILGADLPTSNTSFIYATWASLSSVTWSSGLIPPQDGYAFQRSANTLLRFESATLLDDFGNTYTANGGAATSTVKPGFNARSLDLSGGGTGAGNVKCVYSTDITSVGDGSFEIAAEFWLDAVPAATFHTVGGIMNNGGFGAHILINNTGTARFGIRVSSDGTSMNVINADGATTTVTSGRWWRTRLAHDALAGTYRLYVSDGGTGAAPVWGAEVQEQTVSSTARVGLCTRVVWGAYYNGAFTNGLSGFIEGARLIRACTRTSTHTPASAAMAITDHPVHFYSIPKAIMYEVTGPSTAAGSDPVTTARNRYDVAECDTSGAAVTAVRNRAIKGEYVGPQASLLGAGGTTITRNHNIGTRPASAVTFMRCLASDLGYQPGEELAAPLSSVLNTGSSVGVLTSAERNLVRSAISTSGIVITNRSTGAVTGATGASWNHFVVCKRGW